MKSLWLCGQTKRYHTVPGVQHTVAEHSWGVAVIIAKLHPGPSSALLIAALYHDAAERHTGDAPATVKWEHQDVRDAYNRVERLWEESLGIAVPLTNDEQRWLKAADMLELVLFCEHVVDTTGNVYAEEIKQRGLQYLRDMQPIPKEVLSYICAKWPQVKGSGQSSLA